MKIKFVLVFLFCLAAPLFAEEVVLSEEVEVSEELKLIDNLSSAFERVSNVIKPSVVSINSIKKAKKVSNKKNSPLNPRNKSPFDNFFNDEFLERFFEQMPDRGAPSRGMGSGVVVSEDGYILTNNHVIEGADEIEVLMYDDKKYEAELVGADPKSDIAVIKINQTNLKFAKLGNSDNLKVGQWVVAAGAPFNLAQTITAGIVSATGRSNVGIADYEDFIQTDAAINPGNSGGPLVSLNGEVVGINTAIFSKSGGYMGVGFAIPVNMVRSIMDSLIKDGKVVRGFLGVMIQKLDEDMASSFGFNDTEGALVSEVNKDGPGDKGGIIPGDIIVEFDGNKIKDPSQLRNIVGQTNPEKNVKLKIFRNEKYITLSMKVGVLGSDSPITEVNDKLKENDLGVQVQDINDAVKYSLGLDDDSGVVIVQVQPGSVAQYHGLKNGDVILQINNEQINSSEDFYRSIDKVNLKKGIRLTVKRKTGKVFIYIKE
jgi:serine protease Do